MAELLGIQVSTQTRLEVWLRIDPRTKPRVYSQVFDSARLTNFSYWLEIFFAAAIATFGLVLNSPAVIIGAMLISPLMGPIMATGLAIAVGDLYLSIKALGNLLMSVAGAIVLSAFVVWLLPFHSATTEILSRTKPNLLDLGVAVFSGLAGSVVVCRGGGGGGVTALPGVAIAVALMPPLCTMGFGFGSGGNLAIVGGAGLLFLTNIVAIVSSAFIVFLLVGMNSPEVCEEMARSRGDDPVAQKLTHGVLGRAFNSSGHVMLRILILLVILAAIAVPLKRALMQVAGETVARSVVESVTEKLAPSNAIVSQQVQIGSHDISVRMISTETVTAQKVKQAEDTIRDRTGKRATVSVEEVASKSELTEMLARLEAPPAPAAPTAPPPPKTLDEISKELLARITPIVSDVWPLEPPLQGFDVSLNQAGIVLNVSYLGAKNLDPVAHDVILRSIQDKLHTQDVTLRANRVAARTSERNPRDASRSRHP